MICAMIHQQVPSLKLLWNPATVCWWFGDTSSNCPLVKLTRRRDRKKHAVCCSTQIRHRLDESTATEIMIPIGIDWRPLVWRSCFCPESFCELQFCPPSRVSSPWVSTDGFVFKLEMTNLFTLKPIYSWKHPLRYWSLSQLCPRFWASENHYLPSFLRFCGLQIPIEPLERWKIYLAPEVTVKGQVSGLGRASKARTVHSLFLAGSVDWGSLDLFSVSWHHGTMAPQFFPDVKRSLAEGYQFWKTWHGLTCQQFNQLLLPSTSWHLWPHEKRDVLKM